MFPVILRLISGLIFGYLCNLYADVNKKLESLEISVSQTAEIEKLQVFDMLKHFSNFVTSGDNRNLAQDLSIQTNLIDRPRSPVSPQDLEYELLETTESYSPDSAPILNK